MSIRRMMLFTLGAKIKNLIDAFKARVLNTQGQFEAESCLNTQLTQLDNQSLLDNASLVVTPNGYKETLLYDVEPTEVGTNLVLRSEEFENADWKKQGGSETIILPNVETAPNGTLTGDKMFPNTSGTVRGVFQVKFPINTYRHSVYAKKGGKDFLYFYVVGSTASTGCWFNLDTGTVGTVGSSWSNATIENVGNGWYRCSATVSIINTTNNIYYFVSDTNNSLYVTANGTDGIFLWGAQLVPGSIVTTYIPTTDRAIVNTTIGDMSVTRATTATRVNELGEVEQVPYNLFQRSAEFDNTIWTKDGSSITSTNNLSPVGDFTADTLTEGDSLSGNNHRLAQAIVLTPNTSYTLSVFVKRGTGTRDLCLVCTPAGIRVYFDLSNGTVGQQVSGTGSVEVYGDYYRCTATGQSTTSGLNAVRISMSNGTTSNSESYTGDGTSSLIFWGAQFVTGTQAKPYFPTTTRFNVPRIDYSNGSCPSILVEPQTTNQIRNNSMVSAVVGTPGTLPTNWSETLNGLRREVVGLGVENGVNYIDFRFSGTASDIFARIGLEASTQIVAIPSQTWTISSYVKIISQPLPIPVANLTVLGRTSAGALVGGGGFGQAITPTTTLQRFAVTGTLSSNVTIARAQPFITFTTTTGQTYDFTIRIGMPQMEQQVVATSIIPTTSAAVTRNADVIRNTNASTLIGQSEGTIFIDYNKILANNTARNIISLSDGTTNNLLEIWDGVGTGNLGRIVYVLGTNTIFKSDALGQTSVSPSGRYKICLTYLFTPSNMNVRFFINGVKIRDDNFSYTAFSNPLSVVGLGNRNSTNVGIGGHNIDYISKTSITDAQAIQLTTL